MFKHFKQFLHLQICISHTSAFIYQYYCIVMELFARLFCTTDRYCIDWLIFRNATLFNNVLILVI